MFVDLNVTPAEPEPESTPAESEAADPESERAPAGENSHPAGQKTQLHNIGH